MRTKTSAAVLCGGRGERLRPLTDYYQKTMIPLGPKKRPLLEYIIRLLSHHGVRDITLLTGYKSSEIERYFGDGSQLGIDIRYSIDRREQTGSLNAIADALKAGKIPRFDQLLIYYGDIFSEINISSMLQTHTKVGADATLVVERGYVLPVGVANVKGRWLIGFEEKPRVEINVATGCLVVGRKAVDLMSRIASAERSDIMVSFVPEAIRRGLRIAPYFTKEFWLDLGTITSYQQLNAAIDEGRLTFLKNGSPKQETLVPTKWNRER
jgi:mannose-1-phosphate guanylyltransferase